MIPESGNRFPERIMLRQTVNDPGKWKPLSGKDHAPAPARIMMPIRRTWSAPSPADPPRLLLQPEPRLDEGVDRLRIGLASGRLHDLADKPAGQGRLGPCLLGLVRIGGDHRVHRRLDGAGIGHLLHAALLDDLARIAALFPYDLEKFLGDLAGNRAVADQVDDRAELRG